MTGIPGVVIRLATLFVVALFLFAVLLILGLAIRLILCELR